MAYLKGIDVSKWQSSTPPLTGLDFLIARASIGTTPDPMYATHIRNARAKGLLVGAYHFNWATSIAAQVDAFLARAGDVDFYFLDVEYAGNGMNQFTRAQARDFIQRVRARGKTCGLYMSQSGYYTDVDNDYRWVARWGGAAPSIGWKFWQYQGSPLDKNYFNGTLAELRALAGGAPATPTTDGGTLMSFPTPKTPYICTVPDGAKLWEDAERTQLAFTISPGRDMPYLGRVSEDVEIVHRTDEKGALTGRAYFTGSATNIRPAPAAVDTTPFDQDDMDATVAEANALIAGLQGQLAAAIQEGIDAERTRLRGLLGI